MEEVNRTGLSDLTQVLNQSSNPVQVDDLMVDLDSCKTTSIVAEDTSIFESQENLDPVLPDWLSDLAGDKIPTPTRVIHLPSPKKTPLQPVLHQLTPIPPLATVNFDDLASPAQTSFLSELFNSPLCSATQTMGHQPTFQPPRQVSVTPLCSREVVSKQPSELQTVKDTQPTPTRVIHLPSPKKTPLQPVLHQLTPIPPLATVNFDDLASPAQTSFLSELFNSPLCSATQTVGHQPTFQPPRQVSVTPLCSREVVSKQPSELQTVKDTQPTPALPPPRVSTPSGSQTPLRDELVNILPVLLEVDGSDPLLSEKDDSSPA